MSIASNFRHLKMWTSYWFWLSGYQRNLARDSTRLFRVRDRYLRRRRWLQKRRTR